MAIGKIYIGVTDADKEIIRTHTGWPHTPDLPQLERRRRQLLFVYDEWSSDRRQNFILEGCEKLTSAFSVDKVNFLLRNQPFEPKVSVCLLDDSGLRVKGEIWSVPSNLFIKLDKLRLNGLKSLRHRVQVIDPYNPTRTVNNGYFTEDGYQVAPWHEGKVTYVGKERVWIHETWMYVAHPTYWTDMVIQNPFWFDRVPSFIPKASKKWLSEYYRYQNI